jgi:hypothetical protein
MDTKALASKAMTTLTGGVKECLALVEMKADA